MIKESTKKSIIGSDTNVNKTTQNMQRIKILIKQSYLLDDRTFLDKSRASRKLLDEPTQQWSDITD